MVKIEVRKKGDRTAILISFDTDSSKFDSHSERNRFFSKLHGRRQIIKREKRRYVYHREGILDEVPHIKVDNSVFIVAMEHLRRMEEFFNQWEDKVMFRTFPVLLNERQVKELEKEIGQG